MSQMTLKQGIEQHIKKAVESVAGIFGVRVDLDGKMVSFKAEGGSDISKVKAVIMNAGYEV